MGTVEDFMILPRRQLQMLCKQAGIRANATNKEMAEALERLAQVKMRSQNGQKMEGIASTEAEPMHGTSGASKSSEPQNAESQKVEPAEEERAGADADGPGSEKESSVAGANSLHDEPSEPASAEIDGSTKGQHVNKIEAGNRDSLEKEEQTLTGNEAVRQDGVTETDQSADNAAIKADGSSVSSKGQQGPGGLAQELLATDESNLPAAGSHREPFKRTFVGQKGKDVRLKMAVAKGSLERGALIAERRGTGLTEKPSEPLSQNAAVSEVQLGPVELSGLKEAEPSVALSRQEGPTGPARLNSQLVGERDKLAGGNQGAQDGHSKQLLPLQKADEDLVENGLAPQDLQPQGAPEEGDNIQAQEEDEFDDEKENNPPSRISPGQEAEEDATGGVSPSKAYQEQDGASGAPFLLPDDTLVGSLFAAQGGEEKRVSTGQAAHRGCYKSRPFSARGVERRALAAMKKGMGQRDALLAERRSLPPLP